MFTAGVCNLTEKKTMPATHKDGVTSIKKYPNALAKWLKKRGCKVQHVASKTKIPLRTMWEYVAERSPIDPERLERLATYFQCQPGQLLSKMPSIWNVPYQRNPLFTGREELLNQLYEMLHRESNIVALTQTCALTGLGGIGKTQTVLEFVYRYCEEYDAILWLKADTRENILSDFLHVASLLELPERDSSEQATILAAVQQWMREQVAWLLVLDNVDDLRLAGEFIPPGCRGHILLTTRAQAMGRVAHRLDVDVMSQEIGALFLLRRAGLLSPEGDLQDAAEEEQLLAMELVRELGGLPLALDQAGAYMEETPCDIAEYLRIYRERRFTLLARRGGILDDHPEPVSTTWSLSFAEIERYQPAAADLLRVCAFLDPDSIPEELLADGAAELGTRLASIASDSLALNQTVSALWKYSLVRRNLATKVLSLHRLVQAVLKDTMDEGTQRRWAERVIRAVHRAFPNKIEIGMWDRCQRLLPQAQICASLIEQFGFVFSEAAQLLNQIAYYLRERARYAEAEVLYRQALALRQQLLGEEHLDTAQSYYNLARLYFDTARHEDAESLYRQSLSIRRTLLGNEHVLVAQTLNSIALTLWCWNVRFEEAEQLYAEALAIFERTIGQESVLTAHCMNNLALLQLTLARYEEAERLNQQVLAIRERLLPPTHLDTAQSLQNLASVYIEQGNHDMYPQAEQLLLRSLAIREQLLGMDHPQTARSLHNLAALYEAQGRYLEAEKLYQRALEIREKSLGAENKKTRATREAYTALILLMGQEASRA
jgi:tetratricopeptide (TPR) repeat protein